jgi:hypothetical protein
VDLFLLSTCAHLSATSFVIPVLYAAGIKHAKLALPAERSFFHANRHWPATGRQQLRTSSF